MIRRNPRNRYAWKRRKSRDGRSPAFSQLLERLVQHERWRNTEGMVLLPDGKPDIFSPATAGCMLELLGKCGTVSITKEISGWRVGVDIYRWTPASQPRGIPTPTLGQALAEALLMAWEQEERRGRPKTTGPVKSPAHAGMEVNLEQE